MSLCNQTWTLFHLPQISNAILRFHCVTHLAIIIETPLFTKEKKNFSVV